MNEFTPFLKIVGERVIVCRPLGNPDAPDDVVEVELSRQLVEQLAALLPAIRAS